MSVAFLFALAVLDYQATYKWHVGAEGAYRYWICLGLVVAVFAFSLSYLGWLMELPPKNVLAIFATVVMLFVGGLLDFFFYLFTVVHGEQYSFQNWSLQWKLLVENGFLSTWDWWPHQTLWMAACIVITVFIWYWTLRNS